MITAVDTSVLLDIFGGDREFGERSRETVKACLAEGSLVACDVVWAEVGAAFPERSEARSAMDALGVRFSPLNVEAALAAGSAWRGYRKAGGSRERVIADFLIGAHAHVQAERLLTRDRGFYRERFAELRLVDPTERQADEQQADTM